MLTELTVPRLPKLVWPIPCAGCEICRKSCPAGAIGHKTEDFRLDLCLMYLDRIHKEGMSPQICGICLAVCPGIEIV
jgi:Pyruvate/2-oxoacid:ferredoxin oxidoreductase delta subunit